MALGLMELLQCFIIAMDWAKPLVDMVIISMVMKTIMPFVISL